MASTLVMRSLLATRNPFDDAKDTLSSWDKCMAKTYCKWPVIVAIIVGGLIVLSVVLCIARCVCCGAELACCCFKCCTCCCPSGGRRSGHKRVKTPPPRPYDDSAYAGGMPPAAAPIDSRPLNQQYRSHTAPTFNPAPSPATTLPPAPVVSYNSAPKPEAPQFARFDAHAPPANEDALPAMPSWRDAKTTHVEEEYIPEKQDDVEMDRLNQNGSVAGTSMAAVAAGGAARRSPGPRSPVQHLQANDGYGYSQGYQNGSYGNNSPHRSPSAAPSGYSSAYSADGYNRQSPVDQSMSPAPLYGAAGAGYAQNQSQDRHSPAPGYNQYGGYNQPQQYDQQQQQQYNQPQQYGQQQQQPYGQQNTARTPPPLNTNNYSYNMNGNQYSPREVSPVTPNAGAYSNALPTTLTPGRDPSPVYAPSGSTRFEPPAPSGSPAPAYPGQQTYGNTESSPPAQAPYRAYTPAQTTTTAQDQYSGVSRKPVEGSWKEV